MKKTLTVNLGGTVFHIDEDAVRKPVRTRLLMILSAVFPNCLQKNLLQGRK